MGASSTADSSSMRRRSCLGRYQPEYNIAVAEDALGKAQSEPDSAAPTQAITITPPSAVVSLGPGCQRDLVRPSEAIRRAAARISGSVGAGPRTAARRASFSSSAERSPSSSSRLRRHLGSNRQVAKAKGIAAMAAMIPDAVQLVPSVLKKNPTPAPPIRPIQTADSHLGGSEKLICTGSSSATNPLHASAAASCR